MKLNARNTSVSDRAMSRMLRLGVLVLVAGVATFGVIYYQDQHVDAGPSLTARQTQTAEEAVRKEPGNIGARIALAKVYRSDKRAGDALKQYDEVLKADGNHRPALLGRGSILTETGDLKGAVVAYHKITDAAVKGEFAAQDLQLAEAHYFLGSIAVTQGKNSDAVTELDAALKIDKTDSDALYMLGVARLNGGEPQLAVAALQRALLFVPTEWCEPYARLSEAYKKIGSAPRVTYVDGMLDFCQKRPADAVNKLKTLTSGPLAVDAMTGLGLIAETASDREEAVAWYKKALVVDPANINAISSMSRLGVGPSAGPGSKAPAKSSPTTPGTH